MQYLNVITLTELRGVFKIFNRNNSITFDIETNTLNRFSKNAKLISYSICNDEFVCGIKVYNRNDDLKVEYSPEEAISYLKELLENTDITKIGHNLKFDLSFLYVAYKFNKSIFTNIGDTLLLGHLVDENIPLNLDNQAYYHLNIPKHKSMIDNTKLETEPLSAVLRYNMIDVDKTYQLYKYLINIVSNQPKVLNAYKKEKLKLIYSLTQMENNGMLIDIDLLNTYRKQYSKSLHLLQENYKKDIINATGDKKLLSLKLTETEQLKEAFIKLGFKLTRLTKGGNTKAQLAAETNKTFTPTLKDYTLDFDSLDDLLKIPKDIKDKDKYQNNIDRFIKPLIQFREDYKTYSTYLKGIAEQIQDDNKVHPNYNITGTVTGRLSCNNPNLQNIPRDSVVKDIFIATKDYIFIEFDYSQGELRVLAIKSGDKVFIEAFNSGEDIHKKTAAMMFRIDIKDVKKWQRQIAKSINFGLVYGMSAKGLYDTLIGIKEIYEKVIDENDDFDMSEEIAQKYIDEYFKIYKGVKAYLDKVVKDTFKNGYCETCAGQRRHFDEMLNQYNNGMKYMYGKIERQAKNSPIQGSLGQLANYNISRLTAWLENSNMKSRLVNTVHDSIMVEVHKSELFDFIDNATYILENVPKTFMDCKNIPIKVDFKAGLRWSEMEEAEIINNKLVFKD